MKWVIRGFAPVAVGYALAFAAGWLLSAVGGLLAVASVVLLIEATWWGPDSNAPRGWHGVRWAWWWWRRRHVAYPPLTGRRRVRS